MISRFLVIYFFAATGAFSSDLSANPTKPSCALSPLLGEWMDLSTFESLRVDSDCSVSVQTRNCDLFGFYFPPQLEKPESALDLQPVQTSGACNPVKKNSCQIQALSSFFTLQCSAETPTTYIKSEQLFGLSPKLFSQKESIIKFKMRPTSELEQHLKNLARQNNDQAAAALGYFYFYGLHGFQVDYSQSLLFNKRASQTFTRSNTLLAMHYLYGLGTESHFEKAEKHFTSSANQDDVVAQKALAGMYLSHENSKQFISRAIHWLEKAKELGDEDASLFLRSFSNPVDHLNPRETASIEESTETSVEVPDPPTPMFSFLGSLFYVSPFFLTQQGQGSQAALSVGVTPGVTFGDWAIRGHLSSSFLNLTYSDRFLGLETSIVGRYTQETDFLEFGTGFEFWPSPSGMAPLIKISYGRNFQNLNLAGLDIKSLAIGMGNTFFSDGAFRLSLGAYF